jgi:hypothetical protein
MEKVEIRIGESGDQFFKCPVDYSVRDALHGLRNGKHFRDGLIYSDNGPLDLDLTFREQLPTNEDGSLILAGLAYKNGKKRDGVFQTDVVSFVL